MDQSIYCVIAWQISQISKNKDEGDSKKDYCNE